MTSNSRKVQFFRAQIPAFECTPGCHDCCGPVTTSSEEMANLPVKSKAAGLSEWPAAGSDDRPAHRAADLSLFCRNTPGAGLMEVLFFGSCNYK